LQTEREARQQRLRELPRSYAVARDSTVNWFFFSVQCTLPLVNTTVGHSPTAAYVALAGSLGPWECTAHTRLKNGRVEGATVGAGTPTLGAQQQGPKLGA
jgi:hypothetical protein